jgi:hypothetical protein
MSLIDSLIKGEDCADCRLCCWFTRYDLWETPVIDDDLRKIISERYPETKFVSRDMGGMNGGESGGMNGCESGGMNGGESGGMNGGESSGMNGCESGGRAESLERGERGSLFIMAESPQTDPKYAYQPERFNCPMLTENGCCLEGDKPFECQIWPYRIMSQNDKLLISLSLLCKPICEKSLSSIFALLQNGLADKIIAYAKLHPCIVKEYTDGYPILMYIK